MDHGNQITAANPNQLAGLLVIEQEHMLSVGLTARSRHLFSRSSEPIGRTVCEGSEGNAVPVTASTGFLG